MPKSDYSGGRYLTWAIAEALSLKGNNVTLYTDNTPIFSTDFKASPGHKKINIIEEFPPSSRLVLNSGDILFVTPHLTKEKLFYLKCVRIALKSKAKLVVLNFETPNMIKELSPFPKNPKLWRGTKYLAKYASTVLSISALGNQYAVKYFENGPRFNYVYPGVNSFAIKPNIQKDPSNKRILIFARFHDKHKGGDDILDLLSKRLSGYEIRIMVGCGYVPTQLLDKLLDKASSSKINLKFIYRVNDYEKFEELSKANILFYPSYFEGFGYPPVEASFCDTPCITYQNPVMKEVNSKNITYVPPGDTEAVINIIKSNKIAKNEAQASYNFKNFAVNIHNELSNVQARKFRQTHLIWVDLLIFRHKLKKIMLLFIPIGLLKLEKVTRHQLWMARRKILCSFKTVTKSKNELKETE